MAIFATPGGEPSPLPLYFTVQYIPSLLPFAEKEKLCGVILIWFDLIWFYLIYLFFGEEENKARWIKWKGVILIVLLFIIAQPPA